MRDLRQRLEREQIMGGAAQQDGRGPGWTPPGQRPEDEQKLGTTSIGTAPAGDEGVTSGSDNSEWHSDEADWEPPKPR
jgi:hypothetical protein